jgi:hypothetical protein
MPVGAALGRLHGRGDRHRRVTELAQDGQFQVAVAFALATAPPIARDRDGAADDGIEPGMSASAASSDQRSPRDKLAAASILSGGIRRGSSFLKPPRNLGVGTKTVMPRRSASARSGRCCEFGLTLMAVALFHGSMSRRRAAATSAPAKFGIRPCGGNGKRATPSALLQRPYLAAVTIPLFRDGVIRMLSAAEPVTISERIAACRDPTDDKFLKLAVNGRADLIVSGDGDLLALNPFRDIPIVTPAALCRVWRGSHRRFAVLPTFVAKIVGRQHDGWHCYCCFWASLALG